MLRREGHLVLFPGLRGELDQVLSGLLLAQPRWHVDAARQQLELRDDDGTTLVFQARERDPTGYALELDYYLQQ